MKKLIGLMALVLVMAACSDGSDDDDDGIETQTIRETSGLTSEGEYVIMIRQSLDRATGSIQRTCMFGLSHDDGNIYVFGLLKNIQSGVTSYYLVTGVTSPADMGVGPDISLTVWGSSAGSIPVPGMTFDYGPEDGGYELLITAPFSAGKVGTLQDQFSITVSIEVTPETTVSFTVPHVWVLETKLYF
jgi:hypothetical protein